MNLKREIKAWKNGDLFFEEYRYFSGNHQPYEAHSHPEFQIGLAINTYGKYIFRRESCYAPPESLSIIHSGETHRPDGIKSVTKTCGYLMLYVSPELMLDVAREIGWRRKGELPFFKDFAFNNQSLLQKFIALHRASVKSDRLASDIRQMDFLAFLIENFSQAKAAQVHPSAHEKAIALAREFLDAHYTKQISLEELAAIAGVSKYFLCRKFGERVGLSPHAYQNQLRLNKAKKMLLEGKDISETAYELGFYDQSHFGRYFKKFSGASPRQYAARTIFS